MSDTPLSGERLNEERAFIKRYTESISAHPVEYNADFSTPLHERPRKVAVVQIPIAEAPDVMDVDAPQQDNISITIKSLKPSLTIPLTVPPTISVLDLKQQIASAHASAPDAGSQRLVLKGKALADDRLLVEYEVADGVVIHLMLKPTSTNPPIALPTPQAATVSTSDADKSSSSGGGAHALPELTITTELPDRTTTSPLPLTITDLNPSPASQPQITSAAFHTALASPSFWQRLHALCVDEFANSNDADSAWDLFLVAAKGRLSAGEAAKIRDVVGVSGMGGGV